MKKILIFYSKTASGHMRAAEALKQYFDDMKKDYRVVLRDGLERTNFGMKINPGSSYSHLSREFLFLYNALYKITNTPIGVKLLRKAAKKTWGKNFKRIIEEEKPDIIVSVHEAISPITISGNIEAIPFVTVITDLGFPHRLWFDSKTDAIITSDEAMTTFIKKILPTYNNIVTLGYPFKKEFEEKSARKDKLHNRLLIMGGGAGSGNLTGQALSLLSHFPDKEIIVITGRNRRLLRKLQKFTSPKLAVFGFVDNMAEIIKSADVIITKAGPAAIAEAATLQKPLIITSWIGLQEKDNVNLVTENSLGIYEPTVQNLPKAVLEIYNNYQKYAHGKKFFSNGSKKITEFLEKKFLS